MMPVIKVPDGFSLTWLARTGGGAKGEVKHIESGVTERFEVGEIAERAASLMGPQAVLRLVQDTVNLAIGRISIRERRPQPVSDLGAHRAKRRALEHGPSPVGFAFETYRYDDDGVGMVDDADFPICVVTNRDDLRGIVMSPHDALALGQALVDCARQKLFPDKASIMGHAPDCALELDAGEPGARGLGCTCGRSHR